MDSSCLWSGVREKVRQQEADLGIKIAICESRGKCYKASSMVPFCYGKVLGIRLLMLGFDDNSKRFIVGWHRKCSWGGGTWKLVLKMWMNRYQCAIIITIIKKGNQSNKAGGSDVGVHPCRSRQINNKPIKKSKLQWTSSLVLELLVLWAGGESGMVDFSMKGLS